MLCDATASDRNLLLGPFDWPFNMCELSMYETKLHYFFWLSLPFYILFYVLAASTKVLGRCEPAQNSTLDLFLYHFDRLFGADLLASGKAKQHHQQPVLLFFLILGWMGAWVSNGITVLTVYE